MAKSGKGKITLDRDFAFTSDGDLGVQIAAFTAEHERSTGQRLAMDARRTLGPTKVRVTFRVVEARGGRR